MAYTRRKAGWLLASAGLVVCALAAGAFGQGGESPTRVYNEQLRVQLDEQQAAARELGLDAGGWFTFALFNFDDPWADKERTLRQYDLRVWASLTLQGVHTFYVRGRTAFNDWNPGDNPNGDRGDEYEQPELERAWYRFDYDRLVRNRTGQPPPLGFDVLVGRDYFEIGSGLVLALPLDAVQVTGRAGNWEVLGLLGKTITHTPNLDASAAVAGHMDRAFYGVQVKYKGFDHHEPYAYHLWQDDNTKGWGAKVAGQGYDYSSRYVGAGSRGSLLLQNLRYTAETVFEYGKSTPEGIAAPREKIHAMAIDALLEYLFEAPTHPKVGVEYLFGSGDSDRRLSSSSTIGGNQPGTKDTAFNAFGWRDTGLAFAPRVSNLHVWSAGGSFLPLENHELFRKMEVGTRVFFYAKDVPRGAISDTLGTNNARWAGWEWDAFVNWRITSDLSWTVRYGAFQPGSSFAATSDRDCRQFVYTGITYSF